MIDVAALDTHGMENHEFTEKAKAYRFAKFHVHYISPGAERVPE